MPEGMGSTSTLLVCHRTDLHKLQDATRIRFCPLSTAVLYSVVLANAVLGHHQFCWNNSQ